MSDSIVSTLIFLMATGALASVLGTMGLIIVGIISFFSNEPSPTRSKLLQAMLILTGVGGAVATVSTGACFALAA